MDSEDPDTAAEPLDLSEIVGATVGELRCLLGPAIELATGALPAGGGRVRAHPEEVVDLLRHLALDARDAMPAGGAVTIRTGCLQGVADCAAIVIHETPTATSTDAETEAANQPIRKGRSCGLAASYAMIEHAGGHFHVSCRGRDTVLTICFPLAN